MPPDDGAALIVVVAVVGVGGDAAPLGWLPVPVPVLMLSVVKPVEGERERPEAGSRAAALADAEL
jgi:hypothetical protein